MGIISYEMMNGEVWINENLTSFGVTTKDSFEYVEYTCK